MNDEELEEKIYDELSCILDETGSFYGACNDVQRYLQVKEDEGLITSTGHSVIEKAGVFTAIVEFTFQWDPDHMHSLFVLPRNTAEQRYARAMKIV